MTDPKQPIVEKTYLRIFSLLGQVISRDTELSDIVRYSIEIVQAVLEVENCSIMLMNAEGNALEMQGSSTIPNESWSTISTPLGRGIAGKVAQTGHATLVSKSQTIHGAGGERHYQTDSFICVPLQHGEQRTTIGVVNVTDRVNRRQMSVIDLEMLEAIARLVADAIESHWMWVRAHEARRHLSRVMDGLPIGMFAIGVNDRLTLCNRAARRNLDLPASIELDRPWQECFPPSVATHVQRALDNLSRAKAATSVEFEMPDEAKYERHRWVRLSALPADELATFEVEQALFLVEDMQQMQELADLRRSDQMKSSFLSIISHELRTPLAAVKGAIHLLNQLASPEMRERAHNIFCILQRNSDRLSKIVNTILDVLDLESGTLSLYRKRTDLHGLVTRIVQRYQTVLCERPTRWEVSLEAATPNIYVDESRIGQVVSHLIENALKFTPADGLVALRSTSEEGQWRLSVSNTGVEIAPNLQEQIFTKFFQVDGTLTRETGGSGLGLYLCREIMRLHNGDVRLDTSFRGGASFIVSVPETTSLV